MQTFYLDTETTGLGASACVVEIAIVNDFGDVVLNTLVDPGIAIPAEATAIHGITDDMVAGAPRMHAIMPLVLDLVRKSELVIYNKDYDLKYLPFVDKTASVRCAMKEVMVEMFETRWPKLSAAAKWAGHDWQHDAHRALGDALACRSVWQKIRSIRSQTEATA